MAMVSAVPLRNNKWSVETMSRQVDRMQESDEATYFGDW